MMEEIPYILRQYQMNLEFAEQITPHLYKAYTNQGPFAVKQIKQNRDFQFPELLAELQQKGYSNVVPIYQNQSGSFITAVNQHHYYVMPWLQEEQEEERDSKHDYFFKEAAQLHARTLKEVKLTGDEAAKHYDLLLKRWEEENKAYEKFVEQCEKQWYLSPFELQAVTYFIEVSRATDFAKEKLGEWKESMEEKETVRMALNHGSLSIHHFIYDRNEQPYLTNFEKAAYSSPIDDMLQFFNKTFKTYPIRCDECIDWYYSYQRQFPYTADESHLFLSYLSYPHSIHSLIGSYSSRRDGSELDSNRKLMQEYWKFKNVEYFVMRVNDIETQKKMAQQS
ncbi:spore coat protein YsxE [Metabacillus sp. GX 13764]|uniref:spore coat protein YsxE n=1 Tax=Metabacillus kandeliae TaxID=2900151 RepID=UPI001E400AAD|nr:spore coat protein YsxE [Metabacillus kandeliae]MCD7032895.1 spore coat protein YsxE [Metabacillus kandeliae]